MGMPDVSIQNIISEFKRMEIERTIDSNTDYFVDKSGTFDVNMTIAEFYDGISNALMSDRFASASPWQQSTASAGLISRIESNILKDENKVNLGFVRDRIYTTDIGRLVFAADTPINYRFSDYYDPDKNLHDLSIGALFNQLYTKTQPWVVDDLTGGALMAKIQTFYGNQRLMAATPAATQTGLINLYQIYQDKYDDFGLVSDKAGLLGMFMAGHDKPVKFQFDWRFVEWGIRPNKGNIPLITKWAFELLLNLNLANPYDLIIFETVYNTL